MKEQNTKTGTHMQAAVLAVFAALIAAGCFIAVPIGPVPIVLQNMLAILAGCVLGGAQGAAAVGLFLVAGCIGLPVFSGARGGIAAVTGPTGGFLVGYFFAALIAGSVVGKPLADEKPFEKKRLLTIAAAGLAGFAAVYVPGTYQYMRLTGSSPAAAFSACVLPFLPGDAVKLLILVPAAARLRPVAARYLIPPKQKQA